MDINIHEMPNQQLLDTVNNVLGTYTIGEVLEAITHLYNAHHKYDCHLGRVDYHILKIQHDFDGNQIKQKIGENLANDLAALLTDNDWKVYLNVNEMLKDAYNSNDEMIEHLTSQGYEVKPILKEFFYKIESPINLIGFNYEGTVDAKNYEDAIIQVKKLIQYHINQISKQVGNYITITLEAFTIGLN